MPGRDRTGPFGQGPMSGRRAGYCGGEEMPNYARVRPGQALGPAGWGGRGRGCGWRHRYWATGIPGWVTLADVPAQQEQSAEFEKETLHQKVKQLQQQMDLINAKLKALGAADDDTSN